jgi:tellurite methyltransferase
MASGAQAPGPGPRAQDFAAVGDWPGYFSAVLGSGPRPTLLWALDAFAREGLPEPGQAPPLAIDVGCGEGRDTLELLARGWRVLALDGHPGAFEHLLPRAASWAGRLQWRVQDFEQMDLPPADLVSASYTLPFCPPKAFGALWPRIVRAVSPGGRFAGQFFGDRDSWVSLPGRTHQTEAQVRALLAPFDIERFEVEERESNEGVLTPKHWHIFHVLARRRAGSQGGGGDTGA